MDNPFEVFLRPELIALLTLQPIALQILKSNFVWLNGKFAAVASFVVVAGLVCWSQLRVAVPADVQGWVTLVGMVVIGWFYTETLYQKVVSPMASNQDQPLVPPNKQ